MKTQLRAHLQNSIQDWMDAHCEDDEWPEVYTGEETVFLMCGAAASVFDAVAEAQAYLLREGFFETA